MYDKCIICGKKLRSLQSKQLGIGKECYSKVKFLTSSNKSVTIEYIKKLKICMNCVHFKLIYNVVLKNIGYDKLGKDALVGYCNVDNKYKISRSVPTNKYINGLNTTCDKFLTKYPNLKLETESDLFIIDFVVDIPSQDKPFTKEDFNAQTTFSNNELDLLMSF